MLARTVRKVCTKVQYWILTLDLFSEFWSSHKHADELVQNKIRFKFPWILQNLKWQY